MMERYGVEHALQNKTFADKAAKKLNNPSILKHWKTNEEIITQGSYEKLIIEWLNENKEDYQWQLPFDTPNGKVYFVDLYLPARNLYVEIKGYFRKDAKAKWDWFHSNYPNSELWNRDKLKAMGFKIK